MGDELRELSRVAGVRVHRRELTGSTLEGARHRRGASRIARDIHDWSGVRMHLERRRDALLRCQQARHVAIDLADLGIGARYVHPITPWRGGRATYKMITLVGGRDGPRIALSDH